MRLAWNFTLTPFLPVISLLFLPLGTNGSDMVDNYIEVTGDPFGPEFYWTVEAAVAHRNLVPSEFDTHRSDPGRTILETMQSRFPTSRFYKVDLAAGEYHPRIARPYVTSHDDSPGHNPDQSERARRTRIIATGQLDALIQELKRICMVVHPDRANCEVYGHEIRNLMVIACTEVEAQWKNIMHENGQGAERTSDYIKLSRPMRLTEYRVALPWYPWLEPIAPFKNWIVGALPSQSLPWYTAYNHVKHDRESNFAQATLGNALSAVAGCFVMLCAQYGWDFARRGEAAGDAFFLLADRPTWLPAEIYIPPRGREWAPRPLAF